MSIFLNLSMQLKFEKNNIRQLFADEPTKFGTLMYIDMWHIKPG